MKSNLWKSSLVVLVAGSVFSLPSLGVDLAPPKFSVVDEFGVNVLNGQVTSSLNTVSIGGDMGISHSISGYTNHFVRQDGRGYHDKFYSVSSIVTIDDRINNYLEVLRVYDFEDTADFKIMVAGVQQRQNHNQPLLANYSYAALGDTRHTLAIADATHLEWTKPNGTVVRFNRASNEAWSQATMESVTYPNGFKIFISVDRVTTNTGFGLKYLFEQDTRPIDPTKVVYTNTNAPIESTGWSTYNPKYVQAVNFAVENCVLSNCSGTWPKAMFTWPGGMPRSIYFGDSTFSVMDAKGGITDFYFRSFDLAFSEGVKFSNATENQRFSPRLIGIKPVGSSQQTIGYTYRTDAMNVTASQDTFGMGSYEVSFMYLAKDEGIVTSATGIRGGTGYTINQEYTGYRVSDAGTGGNILRVQPNLAKPGTITEVWTKDGQITYEDSYRNFPLNFYKLKYSNGANLGGAEFYGYDARGNLKSYSKPGMVTTARYPATCDNPKTCNQPLWIAEAAVADGVIPTVKTDYVYHAESGQVQIVTKPADNRNIRAQTRYTYSPRTVNYFNAQGVQVPVNQRVPIWLKVSESSCTKSNFTPTASDPLVGTCGENDEVVIGYEYNSNNLLLTGQTVTANGETLRTCYQYDKYGNQIGKTQPKANLTSCNL